MEQLTIEQRKEKIIELAGTDITVIANASFPAHGTANHADDEFDIPTDTSKYDIIRTEHGVRWKLKEND